MEKRAGETIPASPILNTTQVSNVSVHTRSMFANCQEPYFNVFAIFSLRCSLPFSLFL